MPPPPGAGLKPENLFLTTEGRLKILDFGLAKLARGRGSSPFDALTLPQETEAGVVLGTVGYMSPEQVRGTAVDQRADIFAFGAIVYEMLTGKRAFQKPTSAETLTAILNEDPPDISQIVPGIPPALSGIVHRCLEKSPEQRFQSASDLAVALKAFSVSGHVAGYDHPFVSNIEPPRELVQPEGIERVRPLVPEAGARAAAEPQFPKPWWKRKAILAGAACVVDPRGGVPHKLNIDIHANAQPSWSHDGAWIYFVNGADTATMRCGECHRTAAMPCRSPRAAQLPLESPDGQYVYFARDSQLWRATVDGSKEEPVPGMPELSGLGDEWFPAEAGIYFLSHANRKTVINLFDLQTRKARAVYTLEKPTPEWIGGMPVSKDGKFMLFRRWTSSPVISC